MFLERLKLLGLDQYFVYQGENFQRSMGANLRKLVFQYIKGELSHLIPDGQAVKRFRDNANLIGGMNEFIRSQSPNGAWATDIELSLLAELLNVNFVVEFVNTKTKSVLYASQQPEQPTVVLANADNTRWDAVVAGQRSRTTVHDGNCAYHGYAEALEVHARPALAAANPVLPNSQLVDPAIFAAQNARYNRSVEVYRQEQARFDAVYERLKTENPEEHDRRIKQIESDYQLALKIALSDLPGVQGKPSQATVKDTSTLFAKHHEIIAKAKNSSAEINAESQQQTSVRSHR